MSTPEIDTDDQMIDAAVDAAHGALGGLVGPEPLDVVTYLAEAARELPAADEVDFLLLVAAEATYMHRATLSGLVDAGLATEADVARLIAGLALARAQRSTTEGDSL